MCTKASADFELSGTKTDMIQNYDRLMAVSSAPTVPQGPQQRRKLSQSRGDNTSKIHVYFRTGVPPSEYLFTSIMLMTPIQKYTQILLPLTLLNCDNFRCYVIGQWCIQRQNIYKSVNGTQELASLQPVSQTQGQRSTSSKSTINNPVYSLIIRFATNDTTH